MNDLMSMWHEAAQELQAALDSDRNADGYTARLQKAHETCQAVREYVEALGAHPPTNARFEWKQTRA